MLVLDCLLEEAAGLVLMGRWFTSLMVRGKKELSKLG